MGRGARTYLREEVLGTSFQVGPCLSSPLLNREGFY